MTPDSADPLILSLKLADAIGHHRAGRLDAAEDAYREILALDAAYADAWHLLGLVLSARGDHAAGAAHIERALELLPDAAVFHNNLGTVLKSAGRFAEAAAALRRGLELAPEDAEAHNTLGTVLRALDDLDGAMVAFLRAAELKPDLAEAYNNLGVTWRDLGEIQDAVECLRHAVELNGRYAAPLNNLGVLHNAQGQFAEAAACLGRAVEIAPDLAAAWTNLGIALNAQGQLQQAVECHRRALQSDPGLVEAHSNLGQALCDQGLVEEGIAAQRRALALDPAFALAYTRLARALSDSGALDEAVDAGRRAIELDPDRAAAHSVLGGVLTKLGLLDDAIAAFRGALALDPGFAAAHSSLIFTYYHHGSFGPPAILDECRRWEHAHVPPDLPAPRHANDRARDRRLRIGLVSPDFRSHPAANCLVPLLESHDRAHFEFHCYSNVLRADSLTGRLRAAADGWHDIAGAPDAEVAAQVARDRIDVLVDLAMHTGRNRLALFALRSAPVQATWLAFPGTTGLSAIDFRLTDPHLDPPDAPGDYAEESVRLPELFACYAPLSDVVPAAGAPAARAGHVTLGCLNRLAKINPETLARWARILVAAGDARLILLAPPSSHRDRVHAYLAANGVARDRVEFVSWQARDDYLRTYDRIDLALDTSPFNGGVTTSDALWMGVPVVTLAGAAAHSRMGLSQLTSLGLTELVARTPDAYVTLASALARDKKKLAKLRATVRARVQTAPLTDGPRFARGFESTLRALWHRWCDRASPASRASA